MGYERIEETVTAGFSVTKPNTNVAAKMPHNGLPFSESHHT